jgi:predicted MFS family arabinose efflux permease
MVTGGFALLLFVLWELRQREPMIDIRLLKNSVFSASLIASALVFAGLQATMFLIPNLVENLPGYTALQAGLLLMPMGLTMGLLMPVSGRLFDRVGAFWPAFVGLTLATFITYRLHTVGLLSSYQGIEITMVYWVLGVGLSMMPIITAGMYTIPPSLVSRASALSYTVRNISGSLGIAYLVYVMSSQAVYHYNWLASTVTPSSPAASVLTHLSALLGRNAAITTFSGLVLRQATALGFDDAFVVARSWSGWRFPRSFS